MDLSGDLSKLKVVDLKAALQERGLDTKGIKAVLVSRLEAALAAEKDGTAVTPSAIGEGEGEDSASSDANTIGNTPQKRDADSSAPVSVTKRRRSTRSRTRSPSPTIVPVKVEPTLSSLPEEQEESQEEATPAAEPEPKPTAEMKQPTPAKQATSPQKVKGSIASPATKTDVSAPQKEHQALASSDNHQDSNNDEIEPKADSEQPDLDKSANAADSQDQLTDGKTSEAEDKKKEKEPREEAPPHADDFTNEEDEPEIDESKILLSWYDSDIHLKIDRSDFLRAKPISDAGLNLVWAGARANYGATTGKVGYEVHMSNYNKTNFNQDEKRMHELRCGFSAIDTSLQLGESEFSWCYDTNAKKVTNNKFEEYGKKYGLHDVVGVYLDLESDPCIIEFTLNGEALGKAFEIEKSTLEGKALFPHISTKNVGYVVNFGQVQPSLYSTIPAKKEKDKEKEKGNEQILEGYSLYDQLPVETRVVGPQRPATRSDCEVIMMVGLPGTGKTYYARQIISENPEKKYNPIGVAFLLDKMRVNGEARKPNSSHKWSNMVESLSRSINILLNIACRRRRNYIIDQPNVYPYLQRRRMSRFGDFHRKAIIVFPTEEVHKERGEKRIEVQGKEYSPANVEEMEAKFSIPVLEHNWFQEIVFTEQDEEASRAALEKINADGLEKKKKRKAEKGDRNQKRFRRFGDRKDGGSTSRKGGDAWNRRPGEGYGYGRQSWGGGGGAWGGTQSNWMRGGNNYGGGYAGGNRQGNTQKRFKNDNAGGAWGGNNWGAYGSGGSNQGWSQSQWSQSRGGSNGNYGNGKWWR